MAVSKNTKILTSTGLKFVQDIQLTDLVLSKNGWINLKDIIKSKEICYDLVDDYGYEISVTNNQKFISKINDEIISKKLETLSENSVISLLPGEPYENDYQKLTYYEYAKNTWGNRSNRLNTDVKFPEVLDESLAYFLGNSYGDGYVEKQKEKFTGLSIACSDTYPEIKIKLKNILEYLFNVNVKVNKGDGALETVDFYSISTLENLFKNGILKQKAGSLIFPEKILLSNTKVQMAFFSGFFDADGCSQKGKKSYRVDSCDFDFIKQFHLICVANGIFGRLTYKNCKNKHPTWRNMIRFAFVGAESIKIAKKLCFESYKIFNSDFINKRDSVVTMYKSKDFDIPYYNFKYINNKDNISYMSYKRLQKDTDIIKHKPLIKTFIKSIEESDETEVYDLVVDGDGYWANGFYLPS